MTRVGVTGATGFLGGALLPALAAEGFDLCPVDDASGPVRVDHQEWPAHAGDFAEPPALELLTGCDVVLHLAAVSGVMACVRDPTGSSRVNVEGTRRLVAACAQRGVPVAFASSLAVVGAPERLPVTEETPARPTHEYARQKAAGEESVRELGRSGKAASAVLRMSNIYGGYRAGTRSVAKGNVIQLFARQAASGRLTVNAPGTQRRDFVHIEDVLAHWVATARYLTAHPPPTGSVTLNVASGEAYSVLEIAEKVRGQFARTHPGSRGIEVDVVRNPREGIELVEPGFAVSRAATENLLGVRCRNTVDGALPTILAEVETERQDAPR